MRKEGKGTWYGYLVEKEEYLNCTTHSSHHGYGEKTFVMDYFLSRKPFRGYHGRLPFFFV